MGKLSKINKKGTDRNLSDWQHSIGDKREYNFNSVEAFLSIALLFAIWVTLVVIFLRWVNEI